LDKKHANDNPASKVNIALWVYASLVMSLTWVSWVIYTHHQYAFYLRPLFDQSDRNRDLTNYIGKTAHLLGGAAVLGRGFPIYTYPAPAAFVYKALLAFPGHAVRIYLCFLAICTLSFAFVAWHASRATQRVQYSVAAAIFITALFGYPLIFTADRGNIEGVVWVLAAGGLCFLLRARYRTAAVLIGLATAIKPFSILYLLLLIRRRKYKEAALGVVIAGLVTLASLTALGPNPWKAYQDLKPGISLYMARYITNLAPYEEARFGHSLLDGMKSAALAVEMGGIRPHKALEEVEKLRAEPGGWHVVQTLAHIYPVVAIVAFGLLIAAFYKMPTLNQLTALGVAVTLLPPAAGDYTLLHLYVPFGALVVFLAREVAVGKATLHYAPILTFAVIYGLLFAPLTFLMLYASDAKLLLLLALLFVAARSPMSSAYFDDPADEMQREPMDEPDTNRAGLLAS
jgi:hypothetical protein